MMNQVFASGSGSFKRFTSRSGIVFRLWFDSHPHTFFRTLDQLFESTKPSLFFLGAHGPEDQEPFIGRWLLLKKLPRRLVRAKCFFICRRKFEGAVFK